MSLKKIFSNNTALLGSLFILLLIGAYFFFQIRPINLNQLLSSAKPGTIYFEYPDNLSVGQPFELTVNLSTNNQKVNAVGLYLIFNPSQLRILDLDSSKSFCQFYPEKKYDNNIGTISLSCGSPHPGVSGENTVMVLKFMPIVTGTSVITIDPRSKILLSDGKGTNILTDPQPARLNIIQNL